MYDKAMFSNRHLTYVVLFVSSQEDGLGRNVTLRILQVAIIDFRVCRYEGKDKGLCKMEAS